MPLRPSANGVARTSRVRLRSKSIFWEHLVGEYIVSIAGTSAGETLALALILMSAFAHAVFGAINKGGASTGSDPFLNRGAINIWYGAMAAPFALFVFPWPNDALWPILALSYVVHLVYEWLQSTAFQRGAFTVVYPIARGTSPLATVALAALIFPERMSLTQLAAVGVLCAAIYAFAIANLRDRGDHAPPTSELIPAIVSALGAGLMIAAYTIVDAYGVRQAEDPFTFLAWFFMLGGLGFPIIAARRWFSLAPAARPAIRPLALRGLIGALIAYLSFGALVLATRLTNVGEVAAVRETSIIFGAAIGVLIFRERIDTLRLGLILLIAAAAVLIKMG